MKDRLKAMLEAIEILNEMSRSDMRAVASHTKNLLLHIIKAEIQPEKMTMSWYNSASEAIDQIRDYLADSPSLINHLNSEFDKIKKAAISKAKAETKLDAPDSVINKYPVDKLIKLSDKEIVEIFGKVVHK